MAIAVSHNLLLLLFYGTPFLRQLETAFLFQLLKKETENLYFQGIQLCFISILFHFIALFSAVEL